MVKGPLAYSLLVLRTAWRHSFHAAHSVILALIIAAGLLTRFVPRVEVMVDLHGWQVATAVLGGIIAVRILLAPYWIWKEDRTQEDILRATIDSAGLLHLEILKIVFDPNGPKEIYVDFCLSNPGEPTIIKDWRLTAISPSGSTLNAVSPHYIHTHTFLNLLGPAPRI